MGESLLSHGEFCCDGPCHWRGELPGFHQLCSGMSEQAELTGKSPNELLIKAAKLAPGIAGMQQY